MHRAVFDVIIVGAGPGGSSSAILLSRQGLSVLLLEKAKFPREKVCGDGLTPQAIYWLDVLGCIDEVLDATDSCATEAELYINGEHLLTAGFPRNGPYPAFSTFLERKILDGILVRKAVSLGTRFIDNCRVQGIHRFADRVEAEAVWEGKNVRFAGKIIIGADGANSVVSRAIGNIPRAGTTAASVRTYFKNVKWSGAPVKVYFNETFFPGYGWVFVDDSGKANIGLGYAYDKNFPLRFNLKEEFRKFVATDLKMMLKDATQVGRLAGWWSGFFKPKKMVADRVLLVGDAANLSDPMNGGGIHRAMESAFLAAPIAREAIARGDCSEQALRSYQKIWEANDELEWRSSELMLSVAKNPHFRELYLFLLKSLGRLIKADDRFKEYCSGIFCGISPRRTAFSPAFLLDVLPMEPAVWTSLFLSSGARENSFPSDVTSLIVRDIPKITGRIIKDPLKNVEWGMEMFGKIIGLAEEYLKKPETVLRINDE